MLESWLTDVGAEVRKRAFIDMINEHLLKELHALVVESIRYSSFSLTSMPAYPRRFSALAILRHRSIASTFAP
jgi:hypothetical protein